MNDGTTTSSDYSQAREDWLRAKAERLGMRLIVHGDEGIYTLTRPLDEDNQDGDCETYHVGWAGPDGRVDPTTTYIDMDELEHALAPFETPGGSRSNAAVEAFHVSRVLAGSLQPFARRGVDRARITSRGRVRARSSRIAVARTSALPAPGFRPIQA